jgi:hypothetical protein
MFIRSLSLSLDGMRIDPVMLYAPGTTIRSFCKFIVNKLAEDNPDLLRKMSRNSSLAVADLEGGEVDEVSEILSHREDDEDEDPLADLIGSGSSEMNTPCF